MKNIIGGRTILLTFGINKMNLSDLKYFEYDLVDEDFINVMKPRISPDTYIDISNRLKAANKIKLRMYFITFIYKGERVFMYQSISNRIVRDSVLSVEYLLKTMSKQQVEKEKGK